MKPNGCVQRCFCQKVYGPMGAAKPCVQYVGNLRRVPPELLSMLFSANLLASKRKEDKRMAIANQLLDTGRDLAVVDTVGPYGDSAGIEMPKVTTKALQGMRQRKISPKQDYESIRAQVVPTYTISRFVEALKQHRQPK